jgi:hypothetical protein
MALDWQVFEAQATFFSLRYRNYCSPGIKSGESFCKDAPSSGSCWFCFQESSTLLISLQRPWEVPAMVVLY